MEFIRMWWLPVLVAVFLVGMMLYGHYRGFVKIALTLTSLIVSIVVVRIVTPQVTLFLKENTPIQQTMQDALMHLVGADTFLEQGEEMTLILPSFESEVIENLNLPDPFKEVLLENNTIDIYHKLGVDSFFEYIGASLTNIVLNFFGAVLIFIIVYFALRLLMRALDVVTRLPILNGLNQIAGAVAGLISGLLWLWVFFFILNIFGNTGWASYLLGIIHDCTWLNVLYQYNLLNWIFIGILKCLA